MHGGTDALIQVAGIGCLVHIVALRFREDRQHMTTVVSQEFMNLYRLCGESADEAMTGYDMLHVRAMQNGLGERSSTRRALQLLSAFRAPMTMIPVILQHTGGQTPHYGNHIGILRQLLIQRSRAWEPDHPNGVVSGGGRGPQRQGFTPSSPKRLS